VLLSLIFSLFELLGDIVHNHASLAVVGDYLLNLTPSMIYNITPLSVLIAVLVTVSVLNRSSELTAMKATGTSLYRVILPILLVAGALAVMMFAFDQLYLPNANRTQESLRSEGFGVTSLVDSVLNDPRRLRPHYHNFFQMMLLRGEGKVMYDFHDDHVSGLTLFFLSPGQVHNLRPSQDFNGTTVSFTQGFFDHRAAPPSTLFELPFFFTTEISPLLKIPPGDTFRIGEVFAEMQREFTAAEPNAAEVLRAWLRIFFARVLRLVEKNRPSAKASRQSVLVRQFHLAVERGFRQEQTLADYARELDVTANHLNDVVRAETGRSAGSIVRQRRLLDAQRLLSHSDLTVSEIGYQTGFPDPSYFGRFFRRETGRTPAEFRQQIREKYHSKVA
ncbi:MAG: LptF/LptG family permease, partial [Verrucomicrobiota bacterium]